MWTTIVDDVVRTCIMNLFFFYFIISNYIIGSQRLLSLKNYHINVGYLYYMASVGAPLHKHIKFYGQRDFSVADDIFLFRILISHQNNHMILRNLYYMSNV